MKPALKAQSDIAQPSIADMLSRDYEVKELAITAEGVLPSSIDQALEALGSPRIQRVQDESQLPAQCTGEWLGDRGLSDLNRHNITLYEGVDGKIIKQVSSISLGINENPLENTIIYVIQSKSQQQKDYTHRAALRLVKAA